MSDAILVKGLKCRTRIGVTADERVEPQTVVIDLEIELDLGPAGRSDDLADTLDYSAVVGGVASLAERSESTLLEHLAARICDLILEDARVEGVGVIVGKETPPVPEEVEAVSVRMTRER